MGGRHKFLAVLCAAGLVASCDGAPFAVDPSPIPQARPETAPQAPPPRSEASRALTRYYARVENDLQGRGLLRTDAGGPDVPFTERDLTENFIRIALFDEYVVQSGTFVAQQTASALRRWETPVRMKILFGPSVLPDQRAIDRENIRRYVNRLSRLTRHPIRLTEGAANFHVLIQTTDEQARFGPTLRELVPGISEAPIREITNMPRSIFCSVYSFFAADNPGIYVAAVAVVRAEHPETLRLSCIQEEIAQGLGLPNDSPEARPSVFNDDEEFGLLTRHDELLLRMLYDPRLTPGLAEADARPIVRSIAQELAADGF